MNWRTKSNNTAVTIMPSTSVPVTKEQCDDRHQSTWQMVSAILVIVTISLPAVGWSILESRSSGAESAAASQELEVYRERNEGSLKSIDVTLKEIDRRLGRLESQVDELMKNLKVTRVHP